MYSDSSGANCAAGFACVFGFPSFSQLFSSLFLNKVEGCLSIAVPWVHVAPLLFAPAVRGLPTKRRRAMPVPRGTEDGSPCPKPHIGYLGHLTERTESPSHRAAFVPQKSWKSFEIVSFQGISRLFLTNTLLHGLDMPHNAPRRGP